MTAAFNILHAIQGTTLSGQAVAGQQGPIGSPSSTPINLASVSLTGIFGSPTFTGYSWAEDGTLATGTALKIYDATIMKPATWNYFFLVCDQALYVQPITSATNVIFQILPGVPYCMSVDGLLAAANTTPMSGSAPTLVVLSTVYIQNNSGTPANWSARAYL